MEIKFYVMEKILKGNWFRAAKSCNNYNLHVTVKLYTVADCLIAQLTQVLGSGEPLRIH